MKTPIFFKLIHTLNVIPIKILAEPFLKLDRLILKFMWWDKYARMTKAILQKQQRGWDLSRQLAKHIIRLRSRQIDQWTRKGSDIDPHWNLSSGKGSSFKSVEK